MDRKRCQNYCDKSDSAETKIANGRIDIIVTDSNDSTSSSAMTLKEFVQEVLKHIPSESMNAMKHKGRTMTVSLSGHKFLS